MGDRCGCGLSSGPRSIETTAIARQHRLSGLLASAVAASLLSIALTSPASASCTNGIGRWRYSDYTPQVRSTIPAAWNASIATAIGRWNGISGSTLHYYAPHFDRQVANPEFTVELVNFNTVGLPDYPGISLGAEASPHSTIDLALNSRFSWNTSGVMNQASRQVDVQTIVVHESGHASGLAHPYPDVCGPGHPTAAERTGVMYVDWTAKRIPNADDRAGIAARY